MYKLEFGRLELYVSSQRDSEDNIKYFHHYKLTVYHINLISKNISHCLCSRLTWIDLWFDAVWHPQCLYILILWLPLKCFANRFCSQIVHSIEKKITLQIQWFHGPVGFLHSLLPSLSFVHLMHCKQHWISCWTIR